MDISLLNACTDLLKQDKYICSPYYEDSWNMKSLVSLYDSSEALFYFLKAKTAWLIHSMCLGLKKDGLSCEFITTDIPEENLLENLIDNPEKILSTSYIGGTIAAEYVGENGPEMDYLYELLGCISSNYIDDIHFLLNQHGYGFILGEGSVLNTLIETPSVFDFIEQDPELNSLFQMKNYKKAFSRLPRKHLKKLYKSFCKDTFNAGCSCKTFLLLLTETNFLTYTDDADTYCVYIITDYVSVKTYCKQYEDTLTETEAALYKCINTFEEQKLNAAFTSWDDTHTVILSDGSMAHSQKWWEALPPYTGENIYFGLYINSFSMLTKLLKDKHLL